MNYMRSHKTEIFNDIISESIKKSLKKGSRICYSKTIIGDSEMEETYSYDKHGNLTCIRNSEGCYEEYEYNERGNIIHYTDGIVDETYEYDDHNHIIKHTSTEIAELDDRTPMIQEITVEYEYDDIGNLVRWISSDGDECVMKYDADNNLIYYCLSRASYDEDIEEWYEYE